MSRCALLCCFLALLLPTCCDGKTVYRVFAIKFKTRNEQLTSKPQRYLSPNMQCRGPVASVTSGYCRGLTHHGSETRGSQVGLMLLDPRHAILVTTNRCSGCCINQTGRVCRCKHGLEQSPVLRPECRSSQGDSLSPRPITGGSTSGWHVAVV